MKRASLRTQLVVIGLVGALAPLLVLVLVVFGVEEDESIDADGAAIESVSESGVSPWVSISAIVLGLVAVVVVAFWTKRAVDPIDRMTALTDEIQAGSLDRRLDLEGAPIEIRRLGESFDRMLDRLAAASDLERQRIEDASHELRTPLAALAARLEVASHRADPAELAEDLARCDADVQRLRTIIDQQLASARLRRGEIGQVDNDLVVIVERVVERQRLLSPDTSIEVDSPSSVLLGVDGTSIERAVANLVTNAVDHGGGAPVTVDVTDVGDAVHVVVTDRGPGIDPERLPTIFDRYAGEEHGLGLALVRQVADVYGDVIAESPIDGGGTRVTLRLDRSMPQAR